MNKLKLIEELSKKTDLRLKSPLYSNLFRSVTYCELKEAELANIIADLCELVETNEELVGRYINKFGIID